MVPILNGIDDFWKISTTTTTYNGYKLADYCTLNKCEIKGWIEKDGKHDKPDKHPNPFFTLDDFKIYANIPEGTSYIYGS